MQLRQVRGPKFTPYRISSNVPDYHNIRPVPSDGYLNAEVEGGNTWPEIFVSNYGAIAASTLVKKALFYRGFTETDFCPLIVNAGKVPNEKKRRFEESYFCIIPKNLYKIAFDQRKCRVGEFVGMDCYRHTITQAESIIGYIGYSLEPFAVAFCTPEFASLCRFFNWKGLSFWPVDIPTLEHVDFQIDYLGKDWPPKWWPDVYEPHPSNVMEGEVPDIKVGEGLVGEFAPPPKPTPPKRKPVDPKLPLIDPAAIRRVKLEENDSNGWSAEIPLNRPLYESETLAISLSQEDDDCALTLAQAHKQIRYALGLLEKVLTQIEARLRAEMGPHKPDYDAFLKTLHSPSLYFQAEQMLASPKWGFSVEDDLYDFQFDVVGDQLVDFCPVC